MRDALTLSGNQAVLTRANPLAKFAVVFLITLVLALSIDWMSASVALVCELLLFPLAGLTFTLLWQRGWPLILAAAVGGWSTSILAPDSGKVLLDVGLWSVSEGSLELGLGFLLRGLAIALPAVLLMSCTDPTDLADALAQKARLPHRFVLGTLAAMRRQPVATAARHPGPKLRAAGPGHPPRDPPRRHHGGPRLRRRQPDLGPRVNVQRGGYLGVAGRRPDRRGSRGRRAMGGYVEHGVAARVLGPAVSAVPSAVRVAPPSRQWFPWRR